MRLEWDKILEGWRNDIIPPKHLEKLIQETSEERLAICATCPFQSENARKLGEKIYRFDLHCRKCGCPLAKKTKSLSSKCPLTPPLWDAVATDVDNYEIEKAIENERLQEGHNQSLEGSNEGVSDATNVDSPFDSASGLPKL